MNEQLDHKSPKYRFWLAAIALIMAGVFALLGLSAFAVGQALAANPENIDPAATILTFNFVGSIVLAMTPASLWIAYMLRPGGK